MISQLPRNCWKSIVPIVLFALREDNIFYLRTGDIIPNVQIGLIKIGDSKSNIELISKNFDRHKNEHKFRRVSKRGHAVYLILCFEECLKLYKENIGDWKWILEELWGHCG